jgi:C-terminal processing protease CtpA/Prc
MRKYIITLCITLLATTPLFAQFPASVLSPTDKIYGLSKFWQEVNYNFVYITRIDRRTWDNAYKAMIPQVLATPDDYTYWRLMAKFCALLHDGHTNVYMPGALYGNILTKMFGPYWFGTENIGGKAIITHTLKSRLKEIPIGSEVIEVNGLTTAQYLADSVKPYIASSTEYVRDDWAIGNLLQGPSGASYKIKIRRPDGSILPLELTHQQTKDTAFFPALEGGHDLLELRWYEKDIAYLALNSFGNQKIDSLFITRLPELYKAKALIIDLRGNGGGSTDIGTAILHYLSKDTVFPSSRSYTREHLAAFKAWGVFTKPFDTLWSDWSKRSWHYNHDEVMHDFGAESDTVHLNAQRLIVPTAVLFGHNTASAAEDFLIAASGQKHFTYIGDRSFGSTGQPYQFDLPGGGSARVCTKKDTWPDGKEFVGYGIIPAITVTPTLDDFVAHRDPVIDKSLDYLRQQLKQPKTTAKK